MNTLFNYASSCADQLHLLELARKAVYSLSEIREIDLVHFLFPSDVEFCKDIASKYSMNFTANVKKRVAFFRKRIHRL